MKGILAQIDYKAAFSSNNIDYLSEPGKISDESSAFSLLLDEMHLHDSISEMLIQNRMEYIEYYRMKIFDILEMVQNRDCDILIFPEYSIPVNLLSTLKEYSKATGIIVIAGTHYVNAISDEDAYDSAGITQWNCYIGQAICPIFTPDGNTYIQPKLSQSKFEPSLKTNPADTVQVIHTHTQDGAPLSFSVLICVDSLDITNVSRAISKLKPVEPHALFIVSLSPSTSTFESLSKYLATSEEYVLLCNRSDFGHTGMYLPPAIAKRLSGTSLPDPQTGEYLVEISISLTDLFIKQGVVDNTPAGEHFCYHHLVYATNPDLQSRLIKLFETNPSRSRTDIIESFESFLDQHEKDIPQHMFMQFDKLRNQLSTGAEDTTVLLQKNTPIFLDVPDTKVYFSSEINAAILTIMRMLEDTSSPSLYRIHQGLINQKKQLPPAKSGYKPLQRIVRNNAPNITNDAILSFRGRGTDMDNLQESMDNERYRLILVSGAYGIGKTSFVKVMLKRHYPDWNAFFLNATESSRFINILESIASCIGYPLDADSIARISIKRLRPVLSRFLCKVYSQPKRIIIVDDFDYVLLNADGHDNNIIRCFMECLQECKLVGGKILFISSIWFEKNLISSPLTRLIPLKELRRKNIRQIIQYQLRKANFANGEQPPEIPDNWLTAINNHPLSAILLSEMIIDNGSLELKEQPQSYIINQLLGSINFTHEEQQAYQFLSVFRIPVELELLKTLFSEHYKQILDPILPKILKRSFITYDGNLIQLTEVVRRKFFEDLENDSKLYDSYNAIAANYYEHIQNLHNEEGKFDPTIFCELSYHLFIIQEYTKFKCLTQGNKETLKSNARILYKKYQMYDKAYEIYKILNEVFAPDPEVLAYLGRCSARLSNWDDVQNFFDRAIKESALNQQSVSYLYRDWGHILVRFNRFTSAKEKLNTANTLYRTENGPHAKDPAILSALAYISWQEHDEPKAVELFEEALTANYRHEFTIFNYAKFLRSCGNNSYASELEARVSHEEDIYLFPQFEFLTINDELADIDDD